MSIVKEKPTFVHLDRRDREEYTESMRNKRRKPMLLLLAGLLLFCACGIGNRSEAKLTESRFCLDTLVTLTLYEGGNEAVMEEAFEELERLESLLSVHKEGSDLWNLCEQAGKTPVTISPETMELLLAAKNYYALSQGYLDISVGALIALWDVGGEGHVPTEEEKETALALKGLEELVLDETASTAYLPRESMKLDLGALAKGYMADKLKAFLMDRGVTSAILDLGHNILLIGGKPSTGRFTVGVKNPLETAGTDLTAVVETADKSVVTSGTYERYFERDGVRYHHILDPYTGVPADTGVLSVTILSDTSLAGDALSTTCLLLGQEKGLALIESLEGVEAMFIMEDGTRLFSSGFETFLKE